MLVAMNGSIGHCWSVCVGVGSGGMVGAVVGGNVGTAVGGAVGLAVGGGGPGSPLDTTSPALTPSAAERALAPVETKATAAAAASAATRTFVLIGLIIDDPFGRED
jgi:hypothetical protein